MDTIRQLCGFAAGLERLLVAKSAAELEATWDEQNLGQLGWEALALARRANTEALEPALTVVDRRWSAADHSSSHTSSRFACRSSSAGNMPPRPRW